MTVEEELRARRDALAAMNPTTPDRVAERDRLISSIDRLLEKAPGNS